MTLYKAAFDPAGGARGGDGFTAAFGHAEGDLLILDCLYERMGPFNPTSVVGEISALARSYGVGSGVGDRYSAEWVRQAFAAEGIEYIVSRRDRSQIYSEFLPLATAGRARLLDNPKMISQFAGLERITNSGGRDRIDHMRGQNDDLALVTALCLVLCAEREAEVPWVVPYVADGPITGAFEHRIIHGDAPDYERDYQIGGMEWARRVMQEREKR
jgi:hypothetical protein